MSLASEDTCALHLESFDFDQSKLLEIFNETKHRARTKNLKYRKTLNTSKTVEEANCVIIANGAEGFVNPNLRTNLLEFPYIKKLIDRINLDQKTNPDQIDINWSRPGFVFEPHVDDYAWTNMMWVISCSEDDAAPIVFYNKDKVGSHTLKQVGFNNILTHEDIVYKHYYRRDCPSIFNGLWPHGVEKINQERIMLRLKIPERYERVVHKYRTGTLFKGE